MAGQTRLELMALLRIELTAIGVPGCPLLEHPASGAARMGLPHQGGPRPREGTLERCHCGASVADSCASVA